MLAVFLPGCFHAYVLSLEQILPLFYKAGKLETAAIVSEGGFCCRWYINHILARNSTTETWQWLFLSPSSNTHGLLPSVTSPRGQVLSSRWCACAQQLAPRHSIRPSLRGLCERACVCVSVWMLTTFSCHSVLSAAPAKKLGSLAHSLATSPDVQLWYSFLPSLPAGAVFIHNHK